MVAHLTRAWLVEWLVALAVQCGTRSRQWWCASPPSRRHSRTSFLATRAESRSLCVGIALVLRDMHRQASSASWHVFLRHRLEPKLRCMRSIIYWRQGLQDSALFLRQGPQSGALLYAHDGSCTSGNTAQVAIPTIGLGIDIRSHLNSSGINMIWKVIWLVNGYGFFELAKGGFEYIPIVFIFVFNGHWLRSLLASTIGFSLFWHQPHMPTE